MHNSTLSELKALEVGRQNHPSTALSPAKGPGIHCKERLGVEVGLH
jgi:hypothetical protein